MAPEGGAKPRQERRQAAFWLAPERLGGGAVRPRCIAPRGALSPAPGPQGKRPSTTVVDAGDGLVASEAEQDGRSRPE